ncbi:AAA family ATPase [Amycolatopsis sp. NPDC005232]|uniref:AAA family ATPase n=1 Tax=Amycolatopsis sp. NPDC005232 TaxID=3157027 RepID=UPI0033B950E8
MSPPTGHENTTLLVLRGPSGSGKTTVAEAVRSAYGHGLALVQQDLLRRHVLREHDRPGAANIRLIDLVARHALDSGFHVVLEGILHADRYGTMLRRLVADHRGQTHVIYFDVPFEDTVARHATRPQAQEFTSEDMRSRYVAGDQLGVPGETTIPASFSLADTLQHLRRHLPTGSPASPSDAELSP